jgi:FMN phosphatase YigB (HAD superfamily)
MPTILFDLDDSLLKTNMGLFLPAYFDALGRHMALHVNPDALIQQLQIAVRAMQANQHPDKTLKSVFDDHFYQPLGVTEADWLETLTDFYAHEFPKLRVLVQPIAASKTLIEWCKGQKCVMAIATNPLFPDAATRQRIQWAELNPDDFIFYSTYEDFHFTKPHLSYYAEVLGRCGWQETPLAMIGDNLSHDLLPAEEMGIATFWTHPSEDDYGRPLGSIEEALDFLKTLDICAEQKPRVTDATHHAVIRSTPAVLDSWLRRLTTEGAEPLTLTKTAAFLAILEDLAEEEKQINLPLFESILKMHHHDLPKRQAQNEMENSTVAVDLQKTFQAFLSARLQSLKLINIIQQNSLYTAEVHHPPIQAKTIPQFLEHMAAEDKNRLKRCFQLLNIYKID